VHAGCSITSMAGNCIEAAGKILPGKEHLGMPAMIPVANMPYDPLAAYR